MSHCNLVFFLQLVGWEKPACPQSTYSNKGAKIFPWRLLVVPNQCSQQWLERPTMLKLKRSFCPSTLLHTLFEVMLILTTIRALAIVVLFFCMYLLFWTVTQPVSTAVCRFEPHSDKYYSKKRISMNQLLRHFVLDSFSVQASMWAFPQSALQEHTSDIVALSRTSVWHHETF